ncbi:methionine synthase [Corynebacterium sp. HMSC067D03]|uniref:methionine synthase n=1 Tax=Corynebacterium TaxID=1716 RepID=UPI0008A32777|nr:MULTISPECIES: methionine synthase [Corynebacterium]MDK8241536.1 methionine synthase [Corynebacterium coyleae]MDK8822706.1 methionine synthase [Corynebacterium coyleae]OFL15641.1 methionine synthase [Corynebacterium sp. HMSC067D03]OFL90329.1 methionine synthase [Corynebacterium sp. HMSC055D05]
MTTLPTTAFGLGPLPGTDLAQAADVVLSESPLPHIPQLPDRGVGSDLIGRTAALLEIPIAPGPRGWRVAARKRADADRMARDLDHLEELWHGKVDTVKVQLAGPFTLAAEVEMANGHRMITDPGALRDLTDALLEASNQHRSDVAGRFGATVLQLDEPRLGDVMAGTLKGATDYEAIPAIPEPQETLHRFGEHLLHTPVLIDDTPWQTTDPRTCNRDALARLLDTGARIAIPTMQPRELYRVFDELQIDPAQTQIDVYANPADTLLGSARNYAAAREMHEELASQ